MRLIVYCPHCKKENGARLLFNVEHVSVCCNHAYYKEFDGADLKFRIVCNECGGLINEKEITVNYLSDERDIISEFENKEDK